MPASVLKDRLTTIGIHPVPPHLSRDELYANINALLDSHLEHPGGKNILKFQLLLPNNKPDEHLCANQRRQAISWSISETAPSASAAPEFQHPSTVFSTDAFSRIDSPPTPAHGQKEEADSALWTLSILKRPAHISLERFHRILDDSADAFAALPSVREHLSQHTLWKKKNDILDSSELRRLGVSAAEDTVVVSMEFTIRGGYKMAESLEVQQLVAEVERSGALEHCICSSVDVVTKLDRTGAWRS
ncbi:hypothetical protein C8R46DRAFT_1059165 [Mycena filopes]|nr:hypothetical protein C8R46DRAFT_1059165 [Mycena filopes]